MGQRASQIKNHIRDTRGDLSSNLRELESKIESATDWRCQFNSRPLIFLGLALGAGALLAKLTDSRRRGCPDTYVCHAYSPRSASPNDSHDHTGPSSPPRAKTSRTWELLQNALIGIAATHVKDYVEELIPSFSAQYKKAEAEQGR